MRKAMLIAALAAMTPVSAHAAAFMDGSFEAGANPGSFTTYGAGTTAGNTFGAWTVSSGTIDYIGSYWTAQNGVRSVDLSGNGPGQIQQTFDTIAGQAYNVSFWLAGNPDAGPGTKTVVTLASIGGAQQTNTFVVTGTNSRTNMGWQQYNYGFTAATAMTTLTFASGTTTAFGAALDNVSVTAVPEPATWLTMILGFGLVGGLLRRRSKVLVAA